MPPSLIYLDNNATTKVDPRVVEKMLPYFTERYGNPSSLSHPAGWSAKNALDNAREQVAALIHASPDDIIFTSGATESNNILLFAAALSTSILSTPVEHSSILNPLRHIAREESNVLLMPVDSLGRVQAGSIASADAFEGALVSVILANNEIGTIQNMRDVAEECEPGEFLLHTDATQAVGKIPINVNDLKVDFLSLSAHKFHGPKGAGALYIRNNRFKLSPLTFGGGQEHGIRPGTENVPAIVGMGEAARLCAEELQTNSGALAGLRDLLQQNIVESLDDVRVNGDILNRLPNTLSITIQGIDAEELLLKVPGVCFSTGSACETGSGKSSHVLAAIGMPQKEARSTIRFAVSRFTTNEEVNRAADLIVQAVRSMRRHQF